MRIEFDSEVTRWQARVDAWYFATLPAQLSLEIRELPRSRNKDLTYNLYGTAYRKNDYKRQAKGWGAYGTLTITGDISKYTKAKVLQPGTATPLLLRFSTVAGELGAADAELRRNLDVRHVVGRLAEE